MKTKNNRFSIIPHYCDKCKRYFWLVPYRKQEMIGKDIAGTFYNVNLCNECSSKSTT